MSIQIMTEVWKYAPVEKGALLVLLALADSADEETRTCYPGISNLARRSRLGDRQVQNCIRELVDFGCVEVQRNASPVKTNIYRVLPIASWRGVNIAPSEETPIRNPLHPQGETHFVSDTKPTSPKPSVTSDEPSECLTDLFSAKKEDEDQSSVQDSDKFEEIWSVFPKKKNMPGKDLCRKEYLNALKKVSHDDLLRAANAYAAERAGKDPTFHSRLSKWLRDGNYESYLTSVQSFSEEDLTANQESMLSDGICPPSMKQPDGSPNAAARYWLGVYGYRGAAE